MIKSTTYLYNWIAYQANISCHLRKLACCASLTFTFELQCCKQHKYLYIRLFIYIYTSIYVVRYLHTTRYSHLLKQLVSYSHANPWLWGPLIIHQGNRNCRLPRHRCTISSCHAPPYARLPLKREMAPQDKRYICKQITCNTHTHAHSARERSEARNFLCYHIANGLCWLLPRRHASCLTSPHKFHPDELTVSLWRLFRRVQAAQQLSSWAKVTLPSPQG